MSGRRLGLSLIDVLISTVIIGFIASGSLLIYTSIVSSLSNSSLRSEAVSILNQEIEVIRNMPYDQVGTQNGVPSGILLQQKSVSSTNGTLFNVSTTVRNIDDPFDGTLGGNPNDTAPADYKIVELNISCPSCGHFAPLAITTTVAPKSLESASNDGSLFINVFDAGGIGVSGAAVQIINNSTTPTINLADTANASGILQLVGVPTSTQNYRIIVNKLNYSSDQTYKPGEPANPNPINSDATVAAQTLTQISLQIDKISTINIKTDNKFCQSIGNQSFSLASNKLIGTGPDILKFSTSSITDNQGLKIFSDIEWGTYSFTYNDIHDLLGALPLSPFQVIPNSTLDFRFILTSSTPNSVLITARNAINNSGIASSTITLAKTGFNQTKMTGRNFVNQTDWSLGQYATLFEIDAASVPGSLILASSTSEGGGGNVSFFINKAFAQVQQVGGGYVTSTGWLISQTFDLGSSTSKLFTLNWLPASQPPETGVDSVKFQIASNNDQATWNFLGPDGTVNTFYNINGQAINNIHTGNRYFRYKVFLKTDDSLFTPQINDVDIEFTGICVPPAQALFNGLGVGTYDIQAAAIGYQMATGTVNIANPWQQIDILLSP